MSEEVEAAPPREDREKLREMVWGFMISQAVHVAAKLGIADVLRDRPKTSLEIADAVAANEPALLRLLRALTSVDLLVEDERGRFVATPTGEFLRSDHPQSLRGTAIAYGSPFFWQPWGNLDRSITTGRPAFDLVYGQPFFEHLAHTPEDAAIFDAFATSVTPRRSVSCLTSRRSWLGREIFGSPPSRPGANSSPGTCFRGCRRVGMHTCSKACSITGPMPRPFRSCAIVDVRSLTRESSW